MSRLAGQHTGGVVVVMVPTVAVQHVVTPPEVTTLAAGQQAPLTTRSVAAQQLGFAPPMY